MTNRRHYSFLGYSLNKFKNFPASSQPVGSIAARYPYDNIVLN
jgi:hypothetical protein